MSRRLGRGRRQVPILWSGALSVDTPILTIYISQAAGSVSATLSEQYDFTVDVSQAAGSVSATLLSDLQVEIAVTQAAGSVSAALEQHEFMVVNITQPAGSVSATLLSDLQVQIAVAQALGSISATLDQTYDATVIDVTQAAGVISVTLLTSPGAAGYGWGSQPWGSSPWGSYAPSNAIDITYKTFQYLPAIIHPASRDSSVFVPAECDTTVGPRTAVYARSVTKTGSP